MKLSELALAFRTGIDVRFDVFSPDPTEVVQRIENNMIVRQVAMMCHFVQSVPV